MSKELLIINLLINYSKQRNKVFQEIRAAKYFIPNFELPVGNKCLEGGGGN